MIFYANVKRSEEPDERLWRDWRSLVNMNASELERFMATDEGAVAGLSKASARRQGIKSGQESAEWILRMQPLGRSFSSATKNWSPAMWRWARRQVGFIKRMRGNKGTLWDNEGHRTRKHLSLLIWGHDPTKRLRDV